MVMSVYLVLKFSSGVKGLPLPLPLPNLSALVDYKGGTFTFINIFHQRTYLRYPLVV
jgi:hypothetical protein